MTDNYFKLNIFLMDKSNLWEPKVVLLEKNNETILISGQFKKIGSKKESIVTLIGFDSYILICKVVLHSLVVLFYQVPEKSKGRLELNFETKFEILRQPVVKKEDDDDTLG